MPNVNYSFVSKNNIILYEENHNDKGDQKKKPESLGDKKLNPKNIATYKKPLQIRHHETGIEYTISKILLDADGSPIIICYRVYGVKPDGSKKTVKMVIRKNDFSKYVRV